MNHLYKNITNFRGHAGGTKYAKRNSKSSSGVNALRGPTAGVQEDITTPCVP